MINNNFLKNYNFEKKNIYVFGGSGLIGSSISNLFLSLRSNLIILDKTNKNKNIENTNYNFCRIDLKNLKKINFELIFKKYGKPDVMVNASYPKDKNWAKCSFSSLKLKYLQNNIDLHLNSYAWTAKIFADHMMRNKTKGSIILLSSIYGLLGQDLNLYKDTKMNENAIYSLIKSGIINYVKQMASYYGRYNIRVNSVSPGGIYGHTSISKTQEKNFIKNYCNKTPLKRLGYADEVANSVIFLASNNSSYITGTNMIVDGGYSSI